MGRRPGRCEVLPVARYPRDETDPVFAGTGATQAALASAIQAHDENLNAHPELISGVLETIGEHIDSQINAVDQAVEDLQAALQLKQDALTAATDAELAVLEGLTNEQIADLEELLGEEVADLDATIAAATASLAAAIGLKQDSSTAATDAEVTALIAAHAAGDATDAELAAGLTSLLGVPVGFAGTALNTVYTNSTGKPVWLSIDAGILSLPGQNGHMMLDVAPADESAWYEVCWVTNRNNSTIPGGGETGVGASLQGFVRAGWKWRIRTLTVSGWDAPTNVLDSSGHHYVRTFDA